MPVSWHAVCCASVVIIHEISRELACPLPAGGHNEHTAAAAEGDQGSDRTGVWNGPAPRGYVANPTHVRYIT